MSKLAQNSPFPQALPVSGVDASEWVLDTLFGPRKADAWIAAVQDPSSKPQWAGGRYNVLSTALRTAKSSGHYFSCVLVRAGETRRLNRTTESGVCIFFDDVGEMGVNPDANIDKTWLDTFGLDPTFVVETSVGNFQYTYAFDSPITPIEHMALAQSFKINARTHGGFKDGNKLVRYGRLPSGVNPKAGRGSFGTRLVAGSGKLYSVDELVSGFRLVAPDTTIVVLDADDDGHARVLDVDDGVRVDLVERAVKAILNDLDREEWIHMAHAIDGALDGDPAGKEIFCDFTARRENGDQDTAKAAIAWDTMGEGRAGYGFLMKSLRKQNSAAAEAVLQDITRAQAKVAFPPLPPEPEAPLSKLVPHTFVQGRVLPPREWVVPGWVPMNKVTLLQGDGGDGKTLLMRQLQASTALGEPWIGLPCEEVVSAGFYTEDDDYDVEEGQAALDAHYGRFVAGSGKMFVFERDGEENELIRFAGRERKAEPTKFYRQVRETVLDLKARLTTLDVAVDLYGGNEIVRTEVRALFRLVKGLCKEMNGAAVMSMHVSQSGIKTGGGHSGSTDWSNAARSRLYLNRLDEDSNIDPDARVLTRKKSNYAALGDTVKLRWERGVLVPLGGQSAGAQAFKRSVEDVFLDILDAVVAEKQTVCHKPRSGTYAPNVFSRRPFRDREGYGRGDFERAMHGLLQSRKIVITEYGKPSKRMEKLERPGSSRFPVSL